MITVWGAPCPHVEEEMRPRGRNWFKKVTFSIRFGSKIEHISTTNIPSTHATTVTSSFPFSKHVLSNDTLIIKEATSHKQSLLNHHLWGLRKRENKNPITRQFNLKFYAIPSSFVSDRNRHRRQRPDESDENLFHVATFSPNLAFISRADCLQLFSHFRCRFFFEESGWFLRPTRFSSPIVRHLRTITLRK